MRQPGLSKTRERIYTFIRKFYREHDYAPTVRDILRGCRLSSTAVVQHHLNVLEKEGRIHRDPEVFRSIRLTEKPGISSVPLLGTIAAGEPIPVPTAETWASQALEMLEVPEELTQGKHLYALKVKGLSMIDALIDDGDTVLMEPANTAENGDMVAVWLKNEQEVTLKRFYREGETVCLRPANELMEPIYQHPENVEIQGKVSAVLRKL
ncbi:MAG TPA: repressor LexA [Dehalococcoidia bacterium]|nr:repressor LexA [Dehalococcoidia bacterium]